MELAPASKDKKFYVWDTYWAANRIFSFGIEPGSGAAAALDRHWGGLIGRLSSTGAVLDLACGNGAVGLALARAAGTVGGGLAITAIDEAAIDPPQYVPEHGDVLRRIRFSPRTPMESLPFEDGTFDAVVSQFGIEFGNPARAIAEAARVLKPQGRLSILALPAQGHIIQSARKSLNQARYLLADSGLFDIALAMIEDYHKNPPESAEHIMQADLERFREEVEKAFSKFTEGEVGVLSAMVPCLYRVFTGRKTVPLDEQLVAIQSARTGLALFAARAQATLKAAVPDAGLGALKPALMSAGLRITEARSLVLQGQGTLGYHLIAERQEAPQ